MATKKLWETVSPGGVIMDPGNSTLYETGSWRSLRPVINFDECTHCMICWIFCPDVSMTVENKRLTGVDLQHCKGCGICAEECPKKCIEMVQEITLREGV